ncbi:MAG: hypothetical protein ACT4OV_07195 [Microthrixaceae bacterium]
MEDAVAGTTNPEDEPGEGALEAFWAKIDVDELDEAMSEGADEVLDLFQGAADEVEWLGSVAFGSPDFSSSGVDVYSLRFGGRVYSFHTEPDSGPYELRFEYDVSDTAGRERMLRRLIDDWFMSVGVDEVSLGEAYDTDSRLAVRRAGEANGGAPWSTGRLADDLRSVGDDELSTLAANVATALDAPEPAVLDALLRLRRTPEVDPEDDLTRLVAWAVSWPRNDLGTAHD